MLKTFENNLLKMHNTLFYSIYVNLIRFFDFKKIYIFIIRKILIKKIIEWKFHCYIAEYMNVKYTKEKNQKTVKTFYFAC